MGLLGKQRLPWAPVKKVFERKKNETISGLSLPWLKLVLPLNLLDIISCNINRSLPPKASLRTALIISLVETQVTPLNRIGQTTGERTT